MKGVFALLLIPSLLFSQGKAKKYKLPSGATSGHYSRTHVLVKVKQQFQGIFTGGSIPAAIKNLSSSVKPILSQGLQHKNKRRIAPRLSASTVDISLFYEIGFDGGNMETFINQLYATGYFEAVEPDYTAQIHYTPNDPQQSNQYYLNKIRAYEAWDITKGSEEIIIGIVDSGGDLDHPDLASQLYLNTNDPVDNIDNDNDGYVDNYRGWDFMGSDTLNINDNTFLGDNDPTNPNGGLGSHGTAVAGCAAAATDNGTGIAGVGFRSKILFTKQAADNQGANKGGIYRGYSGILYAASHGAKIINCSWGGSFRSQISQDIIAYVTLELGSLVVASAGNSNSSEASYPAAYDYVLSVAASDVNDKRASFSNFGKTIDIIAPGKDIYTTFFNDTYLSVSGTSFSAPITAGAAALVWAKNPDFNAIQVSEQLRVSADKSFYDNNAGFVYYLGQGRLDISRALTKLLPAVRASNIHLVNSAGSVAEPGQDAFLYMDFTNYLNSTSPGLLVEIVPLSGSSVTLTKKTISPGLIASSETVNNKLNPFQLKISTQVATNTVVDILIKYSDGEYSDYQFLSFIVNPSFINVDSNRVLTTLASNGRIGFENPDSQQNGVGFVFNDNSLLFEMGLIMGISTDNIINNVRGVSNSFNQDFQISKNIKRIIPGERSFSEIFGEVKDPASQLSINYRSLVWKEKPYDQFVILEYNVKNISTQSMNGFHFALFADWDITDHGGGDVARWDASNNLGYVHPARPDDKPHAGIKILKGIAPEYFAIDNNQNTAGTPFGLYDGFTDAEKFQSISSGIGRTTAGLTTPSGNDVSHVVGAGPYNLAPGEGVTIAFALLAGVTLTELQYAAAQADTAYNFMLEADKPVVADAATCYGSFATLTATGASQFNWYKDFTGGEPFLSGDIFTTANLFNDTVFYVSNAENSYESVRSATAVVLKANPTLLSTGSGTICDGTTITLSVSNADEYLWSTGATTQSIDITVTGNYSVNVQDNSLNCNSDSETFEVTVNPSPVSAFSLEGELTALNPISFLNSSTGATNYTWDFGDGKTSTEQTPIHAFSAVKEYTIILTAANEFGCTSSSSETISVITGLEDVTSGYGLTVHPNPFQETITLECDWDKLDWRIMDAQGKLFYSDVNEGGPFQKQISLNQLAPGIFYLRATDGRKTVIKKLVKL